MRTLQLRKITWTLGFAIALAGAWVFYQKIAASSEPVVAQADKPGLGLMTSLPIYWGEGDAFSNLGSEDAELPWIRSTLESRYRIMPLDALAVAEGEEAPINELEALAIIQPRGLSPADNVALDDWVRSGGNLFYVIDPMLTGKYDLSLGDPRHPIVSALVPPVFARWGLALEYDQAQRFGPRLVEWEDLPLPVLSAGTLTKEEAAEAAFAGKCTFFADGVIAQCQLGKGQVTIMADAALFEPREGNADAETALIMLFGKALHQE